MSRAVSDLVLDTNAVIAWLGGDRRAIAWTESAKALFFPVTCIGELEYGALHSARPKENMRRLASFFDKGAMLSITRTTARHYAETRQALALLGKPIPEPDFWIAAICLENGMPLLSEDSHFDNVPNLTRYDWTKPVPRKRRKRK